MKMNVTLSAVMLTALFSVAAITKSNSQPLTEIAVINVKTVPAENSSPVNELQTNYPRVYKKLVAAYKLVEHLNYSVKGKKIYLNFKNNNREIHSVYSANGKINYEVACLGKNIPAALAQQLKNEYPGYTVFFARLIKIQGGEVYHIVAENCHEYRELNYAGQEFTEVKNFLK